MIDLIYTSGNNRDYACMTQDAQWLVGIRSDKTPCDVPIQFIDIDYDAPNFARHLATVRQLRPRYATVPDLSEIEVSQRDIDRALRQADQLSAYCDVPLIVPKLAGQIELLPPDRAIGFSVVSRYGGVQSIEFELLPMLQGRRVHLLGGSPHRQMEMYRYLSCYAEVISADGNMFQLMSGRGKYWQRGKWIRHPLAGQKPRNPHVIPECLAWSLGNIKSAWKEVGHV